MPILREECVHDTDLGWLRGQKLSSNHPTCSRCVEINRPTGNDDAGWAGSAATSRRRPWSRQVLEAVREPAVSAGVSWAGLSLWSGFFPGRLSRPSGPWGRADPSCQIIVHTTLNGRLPLAACRWQLASRDRVLGDQSFLRHRALTGQEKTNVVGTYKGGLGGGEPRSTGRGLAHGEEHR